MRKRLVSLATVIAMVVGAMPAISVSAKTDIQIGDYIQMGAYNDKPLLWRCVDIDDNGPLMFADEIICVKEFDAAGSSKDGSHAGHWCRPKLGSSFWGDSNIRDWLNSTATAGNVLWSCGNKPSYSQEAGFLSGFTQSECKSIKFVTQDIEYDKWEKGWTNKSFESTDQIFLLSRNQASQIVKNLGYEYLNKRNDMASQYWLRTRTYSDSQSNIVLCYSCDDENGYIRYDIDIPMYKMGIRPAFYLNQTNSTIISGQGDIVNPYILISDTNINNQAEPVLPTTDLSVIPETLEVSLDESYKNYL